MFAVPLRALGLWLLRQISRPIADDLYTGNYRGAGMRARRLAMAVLCTGLALIVGSLALVALALTLLLRLVT